MDKNFLIDLGISEEIASKIVEKSKETLKEFIPKSRFDEVNSEKKELMTKISELETFAGSVEALKQEISSLKAQSKERELQFNEQLNQAKLDSIIESTLHGAKARSIKAVKALLDTSKLKLDGETVKGLEEQVKGLQENEETSFLFNSEKPRSPFNGVSPTNGGAGNAGLPRASSLDEAIRNAFNQ